MSTTPKIDDGGPAFPSQIEVKAGSFNLSRGRVVPPNESDIEGHGDMTLRDWFAGQAAASILGGSVSARIRSSETDPNTIATVSYRLADAMLIARQLPPST